MNSSSAAMSLKDVITYTFCIVPLIHCSFSSIPFYIQGLLRVVIQCLVIYPLLFQRGKMEKGLSRSQKTWVYSPRCVTLGSHLKPWSFNRMSNKDKCAIYFPTLLSDLVASLNCSAKAIVTSLLGSFFFSSILWAILWCCCGYPVQLASFKLSALDNLPTCLQRCGWVIPPKVSRPTCAEHLSPLPAWIHSHASGNGTTKKKPGPIWSPPR